MRRLARDVTTFYFFSFFRPHNDAVRCTLRARWDARGFEHLLLQTGSLFLHASWPMTMW